MNIYILITIILIILFCIIFIFGILRHTTVKDKYKNKDKYNIAVCFFGLTRALKYTLPSININLEKIQEEGHTITKFLHTYDLKKLTNIRSNEKDIELDIHEYKLLEPDFFKITNQEEYLNKIKSNGDFDYYKRAGDPWNDDYKSLQNLLCQLNSLFLVTDMWVKSNINFDLIMYIRPDLRYNTIILDDIHKCVKKRKLSVPKYPIKNQLFDRFSISIPEYAKYYGYRIKDAREYVNNNNSLHSETFLSWVMRKHKVPYDEKLNLKGIRVRASGVENAHDFKKYKKYYN